jgi:hypothetical protein
MSRQALRSVLAALLVVCAAAVLAAEPKGEEGKWQSLFDGKNLDGWERHGGAAVYKVEDGTIVGHSVPNTQNTFLCTKERFGDFELVFDVKVDDALNSGVQIRSNIKETKREKDRVWGPQVEIAASPDSAGYIYGEATGRGWLSQDRKEHNLFKNGQWNQYRVLAKGANIKTWLNGHPVADLTDKESAREGLIGLQVHAVGSRTEPLFVRWRNIKIRKLK